MKTVSVLNSSDFLPDSEVCANKNHMTGNPSLSAQPIHDKATNCLWIACCGWNPSFRGKILSSSLKAMNHKNVTNTVWHGFLGLINECSYSHGGKSHTDKFEDFCLALEQWRKSFSCVSWHWTQFGWVTCNQAVPLMWTFKFTLNHLLSLTLPTVTKICKTRYLGVRFSIAVIIFQIKNVTMPYHPCLSILIHQHQSSHVQWRTSTLYRSRQSQHDQKSIEV